MADNTLVLPEGLFLTETDEGLTLTDGNLTMSGDFTKMLPRLKQSNLERELLVKTARIKGIDHVPVVVDATAGMGEDSLLLAAAGFKVKLFEYDQVIAALLQDTLKRSIDIAELSEAVSRMEFVSGDSIQGMKNMTDAVDVVYLDPMFPERQKSGLIKKKFQLLQQLERPCSDEDALLEAAMSLHPKKIVIKRPLKGPFLAGKKPSYSTSGKAIRYDCIVLS